MRYNYLHYDFLKIFIAFYLFLPLFNVNTFAEETMANNLINGYRDYCKSMPPILINASIRNFADDQETQYSSILKYDGANLYLRNNSSESEILSRESICAPKYDICLQSSASGDLFGYKDKEKYPQANTMLVWFSSCFGFFPDMSESDGTTHSLLDLLLRLNVEKAETMKITGVADNHRVSVVFFENSYCPKSVSIDIIERRKPNEANEVVSINYEVTSCDTINGNSHYVFPTKFMTTMTLSGGTAQFDPKVNELIDRGIIKKDDLPVLNTNTSTIRNECVINLCEEIVLSKNDYVFQNKIKNGTNVIYEDVSQIEYIWMDGKIVPKTDELMLEIAKGEYQFMPSPKEARFWLILLGIIGILAGGGWKLYHFWTSDRKPTSPKPKDQTA